MGVYTGAGPTVSPTVGAGVSATTFGQPAYDELVALAGARTTYTPALTAATTNPTLGSGSTTSGRYIQVGKFVVGEFLVRFGTSGTAAGSGNYYVSLPVAALVSGLSNPVGFSNTLQGTGWGDQKLYLQTSTTAQFVYAATWPNGTITNVGNATPAAWSTSHEIRGFFCYEAA